MNGSPRDPRLRQVVVVVALVVAGVAFAAGVTALTTTIASPEIGLRGVATLEDLAPPVDTTPTTRTARTSTTTPTPPPPTTAPTTTEDDSGRGRGRGRGGDEDESESEEREDEDGDD